MADVPQEQIRFAVVLNGGVSLAVWMGGVVLELDRLTRAEGAYADLLDLVGSTARADVVTGTSAGGINGAALALSQVNENAKLERLRDLWAEQGRMEQLLRTPFRGSPVSLLKGDEFFLPRLQEALNRLTTDFSPTPPDERPVDLRITTTLLAGVPTTTHDDLGQSLTQSTHQGSFSFRRDPSGRDDFTAERLPTLVDQLALAARSSASFPFAFEPSFVPVTEEAAGEARPNMAGVASWANGTDNTSRYVVDGGVLVNTPTKEALEAIDRMPAEGPVRRVMLLVFPHAPESKQPPVAPVDGLLPSTIGTGAKLLSALTSQSGRTYVERIEEHNRLAASRRGGRSALLDRLAAGGSVVGKLYDLAATLHDHYEDIRIRHAARDITTRQFEVPEANTAGWTFERVRAAAEAAQRSHLAKWGGLPYVPGVPQPAALPEHGWPWGITMAERLASAAMDLLKRLVWVVPDSPASRLAQARTNLYDVRAQLRELRAELDGQWTTRERTPLNREYWELRVEAFAEGMLHGTIGDRVRAQVDRIAGILGDARDALDALGDDRVKMAGLTSWKALLLEPRTDGETEAELVAGDMWLSRLLALEVAATCLADDSRGGMDQAVDLVQISLQTRNAFAEHSQTPDDKAGGASLSRFSGFLKRSWRVNDWIWGRLDGATMLSKIVCDPKRLLRIDRLTPQEGATAGERARRRVNELVAALFGDGLPDRLEPVVERAVEQLTAVYEDTDGDQPPTCEALAELAAWALHVRIICEELPALRAAILADRHEGADKRSRGELFLEEQAALLQKLPVRSDADRIEVGMEALEAFDRAGIGREPLSQEASSDQVIRTAATAAAVAVTVADSERSGLGPAKPLTRALRGAALLPYWTITGLTRGGQLAQFLGLLGFALGGALLVLALFDLLPPWAVGPSAAFGSATLLAAFGYAALRTGTLLHGLVLLAPVIPLAAVAIDRTRSALASSEVGVTTGLVAVGGVVVVVVALLVIGSLPAPVGTPLAVARAVLRRIRRRPRLVLRVVLAAGIVVAIWAVVRYRLYDVDPAVVVVGTVLAIVFGVVASLNLGRSLQRWRQREGVWTTEHAEPPAAATAGWAAVYGSVLLVIGAVVQVFSLRFTGWEAVLATTLSFGLVLLLVTTWWVPLKERRAIMRRLVEQSAVVDYGDNVAEGLLRRLEGHAMLFRFLTTLDGSGRPVLGPRGLRVAHRIATRRGVVA
ncbi:patatin-like protein [Saccharothrix sp.]|uniref:patatin-like protein n=1 Tax=Saccharothrix sp. TaxID=1873460 RepID=UPI0028117A19|nr:patatin-like protein [Saccharothrix sp.]